VIQLDVVWMPLLGPKVPFGLGLVVSFQFGQVIKLIIEVNDHPVGSVALMIKSNHCLL